MQREQEALEGGKGGENDVIDYILIKIKIYKKKSKGWKNGLEVNVIVVV